MEKNLINYGNYTTKLLTDYLNNSLSKKPKFQINWQELYNFTKIHNVANIIFVQIKDFDIPKDILSQFYEEYKSVAARQAKLSYMSDIIYKKLEENNIEFVPLKGELIDALYPSQGMRKSSDIDIYINRKNRNKVKTVMQELGFELKNTKTYHDVYHKEPIYSVEIHHELSEETYKYHGFFKNYFTRAKKINGSTFHLQFNCNDLYIYTLFHLCKHYIDGGCGIRLFMDMYLIANKQELDINYIDTELKRISLYEFNKTVIDISKIFFAEKEYNEKEKMIMSFIYASGVYGNSDFNIVSNMGKSGKKSTFLLNKIKFFLKSWFIGVEPMKEKYTILNKAPFLLPFCWVHKAIYTLIYKKSAITEQIQDMRYYSEYKAQYIKKIKEISGII